MGSLSEIKLKTTLIEVVSLNLSAILFFKCVFDIDMILGPYHVHKMFLQSLPSTVKAKVPVNGSCPFQLLKTY